ncbi:MAG: fumarylacetoacetase [Gracilimonas sp.]|nr:fumarylacetoacetase [Gracilimonas sp.]
MLRSFIPVKQDSHFPIQNLPFGAFETETGDVHLCTALGDYVVDLFILDEEGLFDGPYLQDQFVFQVSTLNHFLSLGQPAWAEARSQLQALLSAKNPALRDNSLLRNRVFKKQKNVKMVLPVEIGDFTDFYSSEQHARNVGSMFRDPENALLPNWKHLPVGYHGRSSSIVISGTELHRPKGQLMDSGSNGPVFKPSERIDFELEMGFIIGPGNELGSSISVDEAESHIFGLVLLNDWSARDIQSWEYRPLGPFMAKNWATTLSPWIVPLAALQPFRKPASEQNPKPLSCLLQKEPVSFDIHLEAYLKSEIMLEPYKICQTNYQNLYWTIAQQLAHHTTNGCNTRPGDLFGSGTISGKSENSYGSLLELAWNATKPIELPSGEKRSFLQDGDEITLTAYAQGEGFRVGFGNAAGKIKPAQ